MTCMYSDFPSILDPDIFHAVEIDPMVEDTEPLSPITNIMTVDYIIKQWVKGMILYWFGIFLFYPTLIENMIKSYIWLVF